MGTFATMQINRNKDNFYLLQNNTNKDYNAKVAPTKVSLRQIFMCTNNILYLLQNNIKKRFLLFKTQGLHFRDLLINELQVTSYELISLQVAFIARVTSYFLLTSYELLSIARVTSYMLYRSYWLIFTYELQ